MVFACEKFKPYILGSHVIIHTDHATIKYLMAKKDAKLWNINQLCVLHVLNEKLDNSSRKEEKGGNCSILYRDIVFVCHDKISSISENYVAANSYMSQ